MALAFNEIVLGLGSFGWRMGSSAWSSSGVETWCLEWSDLRLGCRWVLPFAVGSRAVAWCAACSQAVSAGSLSAH